MSAISAISSKKYKCARCGHVTVQSTNHYGNTWSFGHSNTCPECPPWAKYPEYGGSTLWECLEKPEEETKQEIKKEDQP